MSTSVTLKLNSKADEIETLTAIVDEIRAAAPDSYLACLFTDELVEWVITQIMDDHMPDVYDARLDAMSRAARYQYNVSQLERENDRLRQTCKAHADEKTRLQTELEKSWQEQAANWADLDAERKRRADAEAALNAERQRRSDELEKARRSELELEREVQQVTDRYEDLRDDYVKLETELKALRGMHQSAVSESEFLHGEVDSISLQVSTMEAKLAAISAIVKS